MNIFQMILVAWLVCGVFNFAVFWLFNQARLARKKWGKEFNGTDMMGAFALGIVGTIVIGLGLMQDLWKHKVDRLLTKQVLFKRKPPQYPAKGTKCGTPGLRSDRV